MVLLFFKFIQVQMKSWWDSQCERLASVSPGPQQTSHPKSSLLALIRFNEFCISELSPEELPNGQFLPLQKSLQRTVTIVHWKAKKSKINPQVYPVVTIFVLSCFLSLLYPLRQNKHSIHRSGWREHGLIKGKADFSSCRSCTDRKKTTQIKSKQNTGESLLHKTS